MKIMRFNSTFFFTAVLLAPLAALAQGADKDPAAPEAVVQRQLDAYNAHDIDSFLATYAEDAQLFEHPSKLLASGRAQLRYIVRFKEPNLRAVIVKRIVMGNVVIDHETVTRTFPEGTGKLEAVAIYEVQKGKIVKTWLLSGSKTLDSGP